MALTSQEIQQLRKIIAIAEELIAKAGASAGKEVKLNGRRGVTGPATRRTGKELTAFRSMLKAKRKAGVPVAELAKKHGVTPSYIYQMG